MWREWGEFHRRCYMFSFLFQVNHIYSIWHVPLIIFGCYLWIGDQRWIPKASPADFLLAPFVRYAFNPVPQGCLWRFLGSFRLPFKSIPIVLDIFASPLWHRQLSLAAPRSANGFSITVSSILNFEGESNIETQRAKTNRTSGFQSESVTHL